VDAKAPSVVAIDDKGVRDVFTTSSGDKQPQVDNVPAS
jgi:hypothetical protein